MCCTALSRWQLLHHECPCCAPHEGCTGKNAGVQAKGERQGCAVLLHMGRGILTGMILESFWAGVQVAMGGIAVAIMLQLGLVCVLGGGRGGRGAGPEGKGGGGGKGEFTVLAVIGHCSIRMWSWCCRSMIAVPEIWWCIKW